MKDENSTVSRIDTYVLDELEIGVLDLSGGAMYIEEMEGKPLMQSSIESFGFGLDFRDGKVVIDYVYESSTANKMGVKPGQLVLKINGQNYEYVLTDFSLIAAKKSWPELSDFRGAFIPFP